MILICEVVGRTDNGTGRILAITALLIGALPVACTFALLFQEAAPATKDWETQWF